jgi:uncharacterized protein
MGELFEWRVASEGAFPEYTFMDTGAEPGAHVAISPRQGDEDEVLFFVPVNDIEATLARAEQLGGTIVQPVQHVPGVSFGVLADAQGHKRRRRELGSGDHPRPRAVVRSPFGGRGAHGNHPRALRPGQ